MEEVSVVGGLMKDIGFPATMLVLLLGCLGVTARWLAKNVIEPLTSTHVQFVKSTETSVKAISAAIERQAEALEKLTISQDALTLMVRTLITKG